jgi:hypothetical protein
VPAGGIERAHMCTDPGSHSLIFVGLSVGVVAGAKHATNNEAG